MRDNFVLLQCVVLISAQLNIFCYVPGYHYLATITLGETYTGKTILPSECNMRMLNRFIVCYILSIFWILPSNGQHWWESTMNWRYSRCTDWKFYTWFHLNSTNGYIIAPFHHFPLLGDIKGALWENGIKMNTSNWGLVQCSNLIMHISFWEKITPFDLATIRILPRILQSCLLC